MRGKLALLGHETKGALWAPEGLRLVAREQFAMSAFEAAAVTFESFGFKHGPVRDADLAFDVRFLPNPHYVPELKPLTGRDPRR